MCNSKAATKTLSPAAQRKLADEVTRRHLPAFIRQTFDTVASGEDLQYNWHIDAIAHQLERVRQGKVKRLIILLPPRHLKSIAVSVAFPAFVLGHDPTRKIIAVSYSDDLATKHHNDCRAVVKAPWYRRIFPETRISHEKNTDSEFVTTKRGNRLATSVGGTLTGRGANLIVIDDPLKAEEANSESSRQRVLQWFNSTLISRLNNKAEDAIIVVMQRLHVDDLAGALLQKGDWELLELQAIAETEQRIPIGNGKFRKRKIDDLLHPERESLVILEKMKASMGSSAFSAQYQQRPIPPGGNMIQRSWLRFVETVARSPNDVWVISWDTANSASELADFSVGTVWLNQGENCYLVDLVRGRYNFPELRRAVLALRDRWPGSTILIEDMGSGTSLIQDLRQLGVSVIAIKPEADKITRLYTVQPRFEAGAVYLPKEAPWLPALLDELLAFPNFRNDDQVDSISQALAWVIKRSRQQPECTLGVVSIPNEEFIDEEEDGWGSSFSFIR